MHEGIHIALKAEEVGHFLGIPVTNTMLVSWLVVFVLVVTAVLVGTRLRKIPSRTQTFFEMVFGFALDYMEEVLHSRVLAIRLFPLIVTLFLFILLGNLSGLIPGIGSIGFFEESHNQQHFVALFHPVSTDLNVTLALALVAFFSIEIAGISYLGFFTYLGKFFNFRSFIGFLVGIIELISEFARLISFSFRLFGNMFAGKTLILVAMFFFPYLLPVPLMLYEVGVGVIQASIFALLTLFFTKQAITSAH